MNIKIILNSAIILLGFSLISCSDSDAGPELEVNAGTGRWYSQLQVDAGARVFAGNCALCHGDNAEGLVSDWQARLEDGSFPPPPLNGSAHAWHHPNEVLLQVINEGGAAFGGKMPAFENVLSETEKLAAMAFFQNYWSDEVYAQWQKMNASN